MPLTNKVITTVQLADGEWAKIRKPGIGIKSEARDAGENSWKVYLSHCVLEWSFEEPVSEESIMELSDDDALIILQAINAQETPEEAKNA